MDRTLPPSASLYAQQSIAAPYHAYDTLGGFSMGSTSYGHEAHIPPGPSSYTNATGFNTARTGYAYPPSISSQPFSFQTAATWSGPAVDKSRLPRASAILTVSTASTSASSSMAIPYSQQPSEKTPAASSSRAPEREGRASVASSASDSSRPTSARRTEDSGEQKEKKHNCWMCHKRFDRPSTLKKHLLVHTGEKAFACETCGRRFGVASNLNRHAKRCALRPVNAKGAAGTSATASASPDNASAGDAGASASHTTAISPTEVETSAEAPAESSRSRKRRAAPAAENSASPGPADAQRKPKRSRRAPSPSRWIPDSLKYFDLVQLSKGTPIPLPPVQPFLDPISQVEVEERDSFDENATRTPYHPAGWLGRLPGPGLMGKDVVNTSGGRLLVF